MSFAKGVGGFLNKVDPAMTPITNQVTRWIEPKSPPPAPGIPNPDDAANAAQAQTDAMRMRRGLMSNIYAGNTNTAPVSGKTTLGT